MIIFEKRIPIKITEGIQSIPTFKYQISKDNMTEIEQVISNQLYDYTPKLKDPKTYKLINKFSIKADSNVYIEQFEKIKKINKERFIELKNEEEITKLFQCNSLGR